MKNVINAVLVVCIVLFSGCNKKEEENKRKPWVAKPVVLNPAAVPMSAQAILASRQGPFNYSFTGNYFNQANGLQPGNVIVSDVDDGILQKITSVAVQGQFIHIQTEQAAITDLIEDGDFEVTLPFTLQNAVVVPVTTGTAPAVVTINNGGLDIFDQSLYSDAQQNSIKITTGRVRFEPDFDLQIGVRPILQLKHFKAAAYGKLYIDLDVEADFKSQLNVTREVKLKSFQLTFKQQIAGFIPIKEVLTLSFYAGTEIISQGPNVVVGGVDYSYDVTLGAEYTEGDWVNLNSKKETMQHNGPYITHNNDLSVRVYIRAELDLNLFGLAGGGVNAIPYLALDITPSQTPWWELVGGIESNFFIYGNKLIPLSYTAKLFPPIKTVLADSGNTTSGTSGSGSTNFTVSGTISKSSGSLSSNQKIGIGLASTGLPMQFAKVVPVHPTSGAYSMTFVAGTSTGFVGGNSWIGTHIWDDANKNNAYDYGELNTPDNFDALYETSLQKWRVFDNNQWTTINGSSYTKNFTIP